MPDLKIFRIEMRVAAETEFAVLGFLSQLKNKEGAFLHEDPSIFDVDEENENG